MAKNRKTRKNGRKVQVVYSKPQKKFVERCLTPKGSMLLATKQITKKDAWERYGKNRYVIDPEAIPVGLIYHNI